MGFWKRPKDTEEALPSFEIEVPVEPDSAPRNSAKRRPQRRRVSTPFEVKLVAVRALEAGLTHREVADLAGVSTATTSNWLKAFRAEGAEGLIRRASSPATRKLCSDLETRIVVHRQTHPSRGVRRISDDLKRDEGLQVSPETVRRVVNDAELGHPPPKSKRRPPQVRRFERSVPNALWQIDIFTFELKRMYRVYLVGIIDDHSRYIVGHGLFRQQTAEAVLEVVRGAVGQWGAPREILSDNGRQFVAWRGKSRFQKMLTRQGIGHVRSAAHHPMTLGKIERFWKTIWDEFLFEAVFASFADASQRLSHWVAYYNHQRPHQGIKGACPADRFYGVAGDVEEAVKQGCEDNALRLALGQETRPPLYLLGKLGETDVRVVRKGEDIEIKLGDDVHEVIRLGAPYEVDEAGRGQRQGGQDEVEGARRRGEVSSGGDRAQGRGPDLGDLQELRGEPSDAPPRDGQGGPGVDGGAGAAEGWPQGQERGGGAARGGGGADRSPGERAVPVEDEVRGGQDLPRPLAQVRPWGAARRDRGRVGGWDLAPQGEKKQATQEDQASETGEKETVDIELYERVLCDWESGEDGADQ